MDYHPLKSTTINNPRPSPIGLSNYKWMYKMFLSLKLENHYSTLMKPLLLYSMWTSFHVFLVMGPSNFHYATMIGISNYHWMEKLFLSLKL